MMHFSSHHIFTVNKITFLAKFERESVVCLKHVGREGVCAPDNRETAAEAPRAAAGGAREEEREHDQHRRQEEAAQHAGPGHHSCQLTTDTLLHFIV